MYADEELLVSKCDELKFRDQKPGMIFVSETWNQKYDPYESLNLLGNK